MPASKIGSNAREWGDGNQQNEHRCAGDDRRANDSHVSFNHSPCRHRDCIPFFKTSDDDLRRWKLSLLTSNIIERVKDRTISNDAHNTSSEKYVSN